MREIRHWQSVAMAEAQLIPAKPFQRLVKEVSDEVSTCNGLRWERDAVFVLQEYTEHVLVMLFEMMYYIHPYYLANS